MDTCGGACGRIGVVPFGVENGTDGSGTGGMGALSGGNVGGEYSGLLSGTSICVTKNGEEFRRGRSELQF